VGFEFKGLGPCGFVWVSFCGLVLVVPVYIPYVLMGALRFLIKLFLLIKKKENESNGKGTTIIFLLPLILGW
jgi:hypothetical protein